MSLPGDHAHTGSSWQGARVRLRAIEPADWTVYHAWDQDADQARNLDAIPFPRSPANTQRWIEAESQRQPDGDNVRFVIENESGEVVGDLTTHGCDQRVGTFAYGIAIRRDQRRKGYAKEAIRLVLRHYFGELRYQKVTVQILDVNQPSIRLHESLGFTREGRLRRTAYTAGRHHDEVIYGLTGEEFDG